MVRRDDISSRLLRIQEEASAETPGVITVGQPHLHGLAAEMYNDPLLVAIDDEHADVDHPQKVGLATPDSTKPTPAENEKLRRELRRGVRQHNSRYNPNSFGGGLPSRRGQQGTRRVRRTENDLNLLRSAHGSELSISDGPGGSTRIHLEPIMNNERSFFSDLFDGTDEAEKNKKLWDQFLQLSEEKQRRVVRKLDGQHEKQYAREVKKNSKSDKDQFTCIDRRLRHMLLRQKPSPAMVRQVESNVIAAFVNEPHSVQLYRKLDSYRRALYHSVCQYAKLTAKTLNKHGKNQNATSQAPADVEVRNLHDDFACPTMLLSDYLEKARE